MKARVTSEASQQQSVCRGFFGRSFYKCKYWEMFEILKRKHRSLELTKKCERFESFSGCPIIEWRIQSCTTHPHAFDWHREVIIVKIIFWNYYCFYKRHCASGGVRDFFFKSWAFVMWSEEVLDLSAECAPFKVQTYWWIIDLCVCNMGECGPLSKWEVT